MTEKVFSVQAHLRANVFRVGKSPEHAQVRGSRKRQRPSGLSSKAHVFWGVSQKTVPGTHRGLFGVVRWGSSFCARGVSDGATYRGLRTESRWSTRHPDHTKGKCVGENRRGIS